jgi:hypothetical protein
MRARAWLIYLAAGTAAVAIYFLLPDNWWQTGANAAIGLAAVAGLLVGVKLHRPRHAGLWWMLAGGLFCIAAGDFAYALYERLTNGPAPFPSLADALYLAGCPLIGLSMVLLVRTRTAGRDRVSWIDATIVASGFGLPSWTFLMAPTASSNELTWLGRLVALAYPVWECCSWRCWYACWPGWVRACPLCGCCAATAVRSSACSCPAPPPSRPARCWSGCAR